VAVRPDDRGARDLDHGVVLHHGASGVRAFCPSGTLHGRCGRRRQGEGAGKKTFWGCLQEIDQMLAGKEWVLGSQFTVCDPFALVFFGWGLRAELPMQDLKNYSALKDRLLKRPAVRKILEREQSPILKAA
jgi:glutathione S-transferase